jgi:hypothetical protein
MKRTQLSFAASLKFQPKNPLRTAKRQIKGAFHSQFWGDIEFIEYASRDAMLRAIESDQDLRAVIR